MKNASRVSLVSSIWFRYGTIRNQSLGEEIF